MSIYKKLLLCMSLSLLSACSMLEQAIHRNAVPMPAEKPASVHKVKPPEVVAAPVATQGRSDFLKALYQARMNLSAYNREAALEDMKRASGLVGYANVRVTSDYPVVVEMVYMRSGAGVPIYVPSNVEGGHFNELETTLAELNKQGVKPAEEYNLVTTKGLISVSQVQKDMELAIGKVDHANIDKPDSGFAEADRHIQNIYNLMNPVKYEDTNRLQLEAHLELAKIFFRVAYYDASRAALKQAETYLEKHQSEFLKTEAKPAYLAANKKEMDFLQKRLNEKLSGKLEKISANLNNFFEKK